MDNIQGSTEAVETTQAQPVDTQMPEVQPESTVSENESGKATTFEELKAKKGFNSPDDLAKAYSQLESHSTRTSQEKANLEKEFFFKKEPLVSQSQTDDQALAELDKFVNERVKKEVQAIRTEWQDRESRRELRETIDKNPDFGKYAQDVKDIKGKFPNMSFSEAYVFAKAQKGDFAAEAHSQTVQRRTEAVQRQSEATVVPSKQGKESSIGAQDMLEGASKRWKPHFMHGPNQQQVQDIEAVEKELFGRVLTKTPSGL